MKSRERKRERENDKNDKKKKKLTLKQLNPTSVSYIGCRFLDALLNEPPKKGESLKKRDF